MMRWLRFLFLVLAPLTLTGSARAEDPVPPAPLTDELETSLILPSLPLAEVQNGVYRVRLDLSLKENGEGHGTLILDPNAPVFDDFGEMTLINMLPPIRLECSLKLIKKLRRPILPAPPAAESEPEAKPLLLLGIRGPKITSRLALARQGGGQDPGKLLVYEKGGKVKYAFQLASVAPLFEPCHPGCFPAGTEVRVAGGTRLIEKIAAGDQIITIDRQGKEGQSKVTDLFVTRNRLIEVKMKDGPLNTTETQPINLVAGDFKPAGELKPGDQIWRWRDGERQADVVLEVAPTGRVVEVFNLVVGDQTIFIANDFLVRSKPPAVDRKKVQVGPALPRP